MRWFGLLSAVFLLVALLCAKNTDEPLDALKARAENARPQEQAHLFASIARREVNEADHFYTEGDIANAKRAVAQVVQYAARAADAASSSGKHLKDTEIQLRETARRLDDVAKTLNFEDRPDVAAAVKQVEESRRKLLDRMFGVAPKEGNR